MGSDSTKAFLVLLPLLAGTRFLAAQSIDSYTASFNDAVGSLTSRTGPTCAGSTTHSSPSMPS